MDIMPYDRLHALRVWHHALERLHLAIMIPRYVLVISMGQYAFPVISQTDLFPEDRHWAPSLLGSTVYTETPEHA